MKITDPSDTEVTFITGGSIEAIDHQTVRMVAWVDMPATGERRIVVRLAAPLTVAMQMNLDMARALNDAVNRQGEETKVH